MDNIKFAERMRAESERQTEWADNGESTVVGEGPTLLRLGADRIERLHKSLNYSQTTGHDVRIAKLDLQKEIERLRSALELIACGGRPNFEQDPAFDYGTNVAMHLQQIAREALDDE